MQLVPSDFADQLPSATSLFVVLLLIAVLH